MDQWRGGQQEAISRVLSSKARIIVLEGPPGLGKTVIGVGTSRVMGEPFRTPIQLGLTDGPTFHTTILTGTKQLQDQYMGLPGVVQVRGRNNFLCDIMPHLTADIAGCAVGGDCIHATADGVPTCGYWDQKRLAIKADEVVTNYAFLLTQPPFRFRGETNLLICDEAHTLRQHVENAKSLSLRFAHVALVVSDFGPNRGESYFGVGDEDILRGIGAWADRWYMFLEGEDTLLYELRIPADEMTVEDRKYRAAIRGLLRVTRAVRRDPKGWVLEREDGGLKLRPVWVGSYVWPHFMDAEKVILMSATILDPELYLESLGLLGDSWEFIPLESPFPLKNRPLIYWPVAKVSGGGTESYDTVVRAIDKLMEEHPNEKGLIHTVNYSLAQTILKHCRYPERLLGHDSKTRETALAYFKASPLPLVLVSPSMGEGVDLPYDQCRWQVICKLPFPNMNDPIRKAQALEPLGDKLYTYDTATALVQMYGRAMRAEDDWGVTYLLDASFGWFRQKARKLLPSYLTDAISLRTGKV